jgi:hypothetical protein
MSMLLDRLLMWIAGVLDRNLLTVPELDDDWPFRNELTCPTSATSPPPYNAPSITGATSTRTDLGDRIEKRVLSS